MSSFQRMRLMRDEEYERLRQKQISSYDPELRVLARLEDERRSVLDSTQLNDSEKVALMNHIGMRMTEVRGINKNETMVAGIAKKAAAPLGVALAAAGPVVVTGASATSGDEAVDTKAGDLLKEKRDCCLIMYRLVRAKKQTHFWITWRLIPIMSHLMKNLNLLLKVRQFPSTTF